MSQKAPPFPGEHDFFAFLRIVDGLGGGNKEYEQRVKDWLERIGVAQADYVKAVEKDKSAFTDQQARAEREMEQREEAVAKAQSNLETDTAAAKAEASKALKAAVAGVAADRKTTQEALGRKVAELDSRVAAVAEDEAAAGKRESELSRRETAVEAAQAAADKKLAQYTDMMKRMKAAAAA